MAKESRKGALAAVCSSLVVACSQQAAAPRPLTEPVWHLEIDNALVIGEPGAAAQTYLADKDLGLADDDEFEVISQTEDPGGGLVHVRLQQLHRGVPVLGSQIAVHADATTFVGYGGTVTRGLDGFDVTPAIDVDGAAAIATRHLEDALGDSGLSSQVATSRLAIRPRDDDDAELDWQIELDVAPAPGRLPGDWFILVDAVTGEVHEAYDGLTRSATSLSSRPPARAATPSSAAAGAASSTSCAGGARTTRTASTRCSRRSSSPTTRTARPQR